MYVMHIDEGASCQNLKNLSGNIQKYIQMISIHASENEQFYISTDFNAERHE